MGPTCLGVHAISLDLLFLADFFLIFPFLQQLSWWPTKFGWRKKVRWKPKKSPRIQSKIDWTTCLQLVFQGSGTFYHFLGQTWPCSRAKIREKQLTPAFFLGKKMTIFGEKQLTFQPPIFFERVYRFLRGKFWLTKRGSFSARFSFGEGFFFQKTVWGESSLIFFSEQKKPLLTTFLFFWVGLSQTFSSGS